MEPADWLGDADRVASLGRRLAGTGVPVDRLALYRRTLHPQILGRATAWSPERPIEIFDREHGLDLSPGFAGCPLDRAMTEGVSTILRGAEIERSTGCWADPLRSLDLYTLLLVALSTEAAIAIGTRRQDGFSEGEKSLIERLVGGLAKGAKRRNRFS